MMLFTKITLLKIFCRDVRNSFLAFSARIPCEASSGALTTSGLPLSPSSTSPSVCSARDSTHIFVWAEWPRSEIAFFVSSLLFLIENAMQRMILESRYGSGQSRFQSMWQFSSATRLSIPNALYANISSILRDNRECLCTRRCFVASVSSVCTYRKATLRCSKYISALF